MQASGVPQRETEAQRAPGQLGAPVVWALVSVVPSVGAVVPYAPVRPDAQAGPAVVLAPVADLAAELVLFQASAAAAPEAYPAVVYLALRALPAEAACPVCPRQVNRWISQLLARVAEGEAEMSCVSEFPPEESQVGPDSSPKPAAWTRTSRAAEAEESWP